MSQEHALKRDSDEEFEGKHLPLLILSNRYSSKSRPVPVERLHADEESLLANIAENSQEAIVSCLNLHWINDLPGLCCILLVIIRH